MASSPKRTASREAEASQFELCLRIKHPTLDPKIITDTLAIAPEHTAKAGYAVLESGARQLHSESYWLAVLPTPTVKEMLERWREFRPAMAQGERPVASQEDLSPQIMATFYDGFILMSLKKLTAHREFFRQIYREQGTVTLMVERPDDRSPLTITPALSAQLADLSIALEVD